MSDHDLHPCPKCGHRLGLHDLLPESLEALEPWEAVCRVSQGGCGHTGPWAQTTTAAAAAWNRRAKETPDDAQT